MNVNNKEKYYLVKYAIPKIRPKVRPKPSKVLAKPIQVPRDTDVFPIKSKPPAGKQPAAVTNPSGGSKGTSPITGKQKEVTAKPKSLDRELRGNSPLEQQRELFMRKWFPNETELKRFGTPQATWKSPWKTR